MNPALCHAKLVDPNAVNFTPEHLHICDYAPVWKDCMYVGHALQGMSNEQ